MVLVLAVFAAFGYHWVPGEHVISFTAAVPLLALAYVLGIITDRVADVLFSPSAAKLRAKHFEDDAAYQRAKDLLTVRTQLGGLAEYNRSRLRVARGWALNCGLSLVVGNLLIWLQLPQHHPRVGISVFSSLVLLLVGGGSLFAWYRLSSAGYERLASQIELVWQTDAGKNG